MTSRCWSVTEAGAPLGPRPTRMSSELRTGPGTTEVRSRSGRRPRLTFASGSTPSIGAGSRIVSPAGPGEPATGAAAAFAAPAQTGSPRTAQVGSTNSAQAASRPRHVRTPAMRADYRRQLMSNHPAKQEATPVEPAVARARLEELLAELDASAAVVSAAGGGETGELSSFDQH